MKHKNTGNDCPRCGVEIPAGRVACRNDWYALPEDIRLRINLHFTPKQTIQTATEDYIQAYREALKWYQGNPLAAGASS